VLRNAFYRHELFQLKDTRAMSQIAMPGSAEAKSVSAAWNAHVGWPVCASAPALCTFMRYFRRDGEPRGKTNPAGNEFCFGPAPGGLSLMLWRSDGVDAVMLFNRGGNIAAADLVRDLGTAIDRVKSAE
jgi:hypothetical protein